MGYGNMSLDDYADAIGEMNEKKGWARDFTCPENGTDRILAKLALVHSEASEGVEAVRVGQLDMWFDEAHGNKPEGLVVEMTDTLIRMLHIDYLMRKQGLTKHSMLDALRAKMEYNSGRDFRHGGKLA